MSRRSIFRAASALASSAVLLGAGSAVADASVPAHAAGATSITVAASEYKFVLSKPSLPKPGSVTFKITNKGKEPHNFQIDGKTSSMLQPGKSTTLTVAFSKAGSYPYKCTVPGHAQLGMKGNFKVL